MCHIFHPLPLPRVDTGRCTRRCLHFTPDTAKSAWRSQALAQEPATISPLLRRLETAGSITRQRRDGNERTLDVRLTAAGAALRQQALAVPGTMMAKLGLTRDQVAALHASMTALAAATRAAGSQATGPIPAEAPRR